MMRIYYPVITLLQHAYKSFTLFWHGGTVSCNARAMLHSSADWLFRVFVHVLIAWVPPGSPVAFHLSKADTLPCDNPIHDVFSPHALSSQDK